MRHFPTLWIFWLLVVIVLAIAVPWAVYDDPRCIVAECRIQKD